MIMKGKYVMKEDKYISAMNSMDIPPEMKRSIVSRITQATYNQKNHLTKKENYKMFSKKKFALVTAAAIIVLGIAVFAASGIVTSWYGFSSSIPEYTSLPSVEQTIKDVGYAPVLMERFNNGYVFDDGSVLENSLEDDGNNSIEKFKSFSFRYTKDGDTISFTQAQYNAETQQYGVLIASENGTDIYNTGYTNKVVPPDYKQTEEDMKAEESGELVFTYGSDDVSISEVNAVSWEIGNMHFDLLQIDGKLSNDELLQMAKEVIAQN